MGRRVTKRELLEELREIHQFYMSEIMFVRSMRKIKEIRNHIGFIPVERYAFGRPVTGEIGRIGLVRFRTDSRKR